MRFFSDVPQAVPALFDHARLIRKLKKSDSGGIRGLTSSGEVQFKFRA